MRLVVASRNPGKLAEIRELLRGLPIEVLDASEARLAEVEETGDTYAANALLKARSARDQTGLAALADDSGLEVEALGGAPGVRSARFAGEEATDALRCERVLSLLREARDPDRRARFRCAIALAYPGGEEDLLEASCEGRIAEAPRGARGFGYDPIFEVSILGRTMAELTREEKAAVSHRGKALRLAREALQRRLARAGDAPREDPL